MNLISLFFLIPICFLLTTPSFARKFRQVDAKISGTSYLGNAGNKATITLAKKACEIQSLGKDGEDGNPPKEFKIEVTCGSKKQTLWDISKPTDDDVAFDEPKFELLWAGDRDGDQKIDFEMDLSPKYSCRRNVVFLSSKANPDQIVGIAGHPKKICGD